MSERDDPQTAEDPEDPAAGSVANPFAIGNEDDIENEMRNVALSRRRAAMLGLISGAIMVGILVICFLLVTLLAWLTS